MSRSLAQEIAELPEKDQDAAMEGLDPEELLYDWRFWGRPEQFEPNEDWWNVWAVVAGRGFGKTRLGAEWVKEKVQTPKTRIALVARTAGDTRDTMVEGDSGILSVYPPSEQPKYSPANRRVTWANGSIAQTFSADVPDQTRGPQFHYAWCDEMASWNHVPGIDGLTAWDNVQVATRLGDFPKILATTTPKRLPAMYELLEREGDDVIVTRGSTLDNAGNLKENYLKFIFGRYKGTRMEQQELYGILMGDVEGALWGQDVIDQHRVMAVPVGLPFKVIAVDPSVAEAPKDECGIIVAGATGHSSVAARHAFVLEDASVLGSPDVWAKKVVEMYEKWQCPVVVEINQGGGLVARMIHSIDKSIPIIEIHAYKGKAVRAEPAYLKYDQGKVHHIGFLGNLESQLTSWVPGETKKSPDRLDALVYAILSLLVVPDKSMTRSKLKGRSLNKNPIQGVKTRGLARGLFNRR